MVLKDNPASSVALADLVAKRDDITKKFTAMSKSLDPEKIQTLCSRKLWKRLFSCLLDSHLIKRPFNRENNISSFKSTATQQPLQAITSWLEFVEKEVMYCLLCIIVQQIVNSFNLLSRSSRKEL
jgi:hypothetical protein